MRSSSLVERLKKQSVYAGIFYRRGRVPSRYFPYLAYGKKYVLSRGPETPPFLTDQNDFRAMPGLGGAMLANRLTAMAIFSLSV
jgi:hypothetical protein